MYVLDDFKLSRKIHFDFQMNYNGCLYDLL